VIRENAINTLERAVTTNDGKLDAIDRVDIVRDRYLAFEGVEGLVLDVPQRPRSSSVTGDGGSSAATTALR
jgi:hypothetical protein